MFNPGLSEIQELVATCDDTIDKLKGMGISPHNEKKLERIYTVREVEDMVQRSRTTISAHVASGDSAVDPVKHEGSGRVKGYTLEQVNKLREEFGTLPHRPAGSQCKVIAVQSFKGGVSKSVTSVHLSQYLATKGYRVLLVDCDPQASATSSFGFMPDSDFTIDNTMYRYFDGLAESLDYAIRKTYFPGVDLIPSCLAWYEVEFKMFDAVSNASDEDAGGFYQLLRDGLDTVADNYDMVIVDSPPALGMTSVNILAAADGIIVPTPPSMFDFSSTTQYFKMVDRVMQTAVPGKRFDFIKVLATKVERNKSRQMDFLDVLRTRFGFTMLRSTFLSTSQIPNAASFFRTLYDLPKSDLDRNVMTMLDELFAEIEGLIIRAWEGDHE